MHDLKIKTWEVRSKVWLEVEGRPVMGQGRKDILLAIDRHGSILHAAHATGISYRRIRGAIRDMEKALGKELVRSHRGGENGGGAYLTEAAHELVNRFDKVSSGVQQEMDSRLKAAFEFF